MLRQRPLRRRLGILLVVVGGLLMWLAPGPTFDSLSIAGLVLLLAGILLEIVGISLEHREASRK